MRYTFVQNLKHFFWLGILYVLSNSSNAWLFCVGIVCNMGSINTSGRLKQRLCSLNMYNFPV